MLMGARFDEGNMGVSALAAGALSAIVTGGPDVTPILLDYDKEPKRFRIRFDGARPSLGVDLVNLRFSKKVYLQNNVARLLVQEVIGRIPGLEKLHKNNPWLEKLEKADLVLSIAGGDSFSDIYGLGRLFYVSLPQVLALAAHRPLVLLPQTLGPFSGRIAKTMAREILTRAALVYSRDYAGLQEMRDFLGPRFEATRFRFCYDVGFVVEHRRPESMDLGGVGEGHRPHPLVGLNVSGLLWNGGYTGANQFGLTADYRLLVDRLIGHLIKDKRTTVLLVPHVFGAREDSESDSVVCEKLYQELKPKYADRLAVVRGWYDVGEIKWIIGQCDFFLGSRMHACIGAISQHIPTVPIAYSKKFIGVMETVGMDRYVADPRTMDIDEILGVVDKTWDERDQIRRHLEQKMPEVRTRVLGLFREITEALGLNRETGASFAKY